MFPRGNDFVRKYHWPNTIIPSATSLSVAFNETLKGRFSLETVEDFGSRTSTHRSFSLSVF